MALLGIAFLFLSSLFGWYLNREFQTNTHQVYLCLEDFEHIGNIPAEIEPFIPIGCDVIDCCPGCPGPPFQIDWIVDQIDPFFESFSFLPVDLLTSPESLELEGFELVQPSDGAAKQFRLLGSRGIISGLRFEKPGKSGGFNPVATFKGRPREGSYQIEIRQLAVGFSTKLRRDLLLYNVHSCPTPAQPQPLTQALWVFPTPGATFDITNAAQQDDLIALSAASGVDVLYVSVYKCDPCDSEPIRRMDDDESISNLIVKAHEEGIEVWAAYGDPLWPDQWAGTNPTDFLTESEKFGCTNESPKYHSFHRIQDVIEYNSANELAGFDGVIIDVEVPTQTNSGELVQQFDLRTDEEKENWFISLLEIYQCFHETLDGAGIKMAVAIQHFWDSSVVYASGATSSDQPVYEHIIDMELDNVVVMGYRDFAGAGTTCPAEDGVICLVQDEIEYADDLGESDLILVGLETANCVPGCGDENVTFFEEGLTALVDQAMVVAEAFEDSDSFGGFAIHRFRDSYLLGWPETSPEFP